MSAPRSRRSAGGTGLLVALVWAVAALGLGSLPTYAAAPSGPVSATRSAVATGSPVPIAEPIRIAVDSLEPKAPKPGDMVTVVGSLTNSAADAQDNVRVRLQIGPRLDSRNLLADAVRNPPTYQRATAAAPVVGPVPARGVIPFVYTTPIEDLGLGRLGVYPVRIEVRDRTNRVLGQVDTFLPWFPTGVAAGSATRLAWVWPVTSRPHRAVGRTFIDDDLAREITSGGRLDTLVSAATTAAAIPLGAPESTAAVPVTWALDADLVDTVATMTTAYDVVSPEGQRSPGTGTADAVAWLARLRGATAGQQVLALPYADLDVDAAARAGLDAEVGAAIGAGRDGLAKLLDGSRMMATGSWPPDGFASPAALAAYGRGGDSTVLLDDRALPARDPLCCSTTNAHASVTADGSPFDVAILDSGLTNALADSTTTAGGARLAEQRFLAETAMITAERSDSRVLVAAPPRRWAPDPAFAAKVLADTATVPWLAPARLADVLAAPVPTAPRALAYPAPAVAAELSPAYLGVVAHARAQLGSLRSSLPNDDLTAPVRQGLLRSMAAGWRDDIRAGTALRGRVVAAGTALRDRIRVTSAGRVTLTSSHGAIPVTLANDLDQPVQVVLRLDARNAARLQARGGDVQTVAAHSSRQAQFNVAVLTSGEFTVSVTLLTLDGAAVGEPAQLLVRSTAYGRLALGVTGAAAGLLVLAAGIRLSRRASRARRPPNRPDVRV